MWFYKYKVEWYNSSTEEILEEFGLVCEETYDKATRRISDYYGESAIIELSIEQIGESENILIENDYK
jgi:hypothetical protein